jgi:malonyl-CoA decarboxylase
MRGFLSNLLRMLRERDGTDMRFLCRQLLSERGEASQGALAQEIIAAYNAMNPQQRRAFFDLLERDFSSDDDSIKRAIAAYQQKPGPETQEALFEAVEPLRQELFRRINTAPRGTETLVSLRADLLSNSNDASHHPALDSDLRHLFKSWFNRGFLRLQRISWETSALILEKLICYESVHEINGWPDLRRRLEADRRCFAFFHPALADEPVIFVEVALANGLAGNLEPLLDIEAPVLAPKKRTPPSSTRSTTA